MKMNVNVFEPNKKIISEKKILNPSHYKDIDTGKRREVVFFDENGIRQVEQRPVIDRVFIPAAAQSVEKEVDVFEVETIDRNGLSEFHEFRTLVDRDRFLKGLQNV